MDVPIGGSGLDVRFDFHVFLSLKVNRQTTARHHLGRRADQLSRSF
jgi:hypothetical protein